MMELKKKKKNHVWIGFSYVWEEYHCQLTPLLVESGMTVIGMVQEIRGKDVEL